MGKYHSIVIHAMIKGGLQSTSMYNKTYIEPWVFFLQT